MKIKKTDIKTLNEALNSWIKLTEAKLDNITVNDLLNAEVLDPREIKCDKKYKDFLDWFGTEDMGRYDVTSGIILKVNGTYILGYSNSFEERTETFVIATNKGNYFLTLQDCDKFLKTFKSLSDSDEDSDKVNSAFLKFIKSLGMTPISLDKLRDKQNYEEAKRDKLLVLDVPREVLNWYDDVKDKDRVPFEILVKAVNQWVGKAIKEEESEVLGSILMNIYKAYGINFAKGKGSWKKYKG